MKLEEFGLLRLQLLVEVVDSGGFGAAARRFNLTQPAVSFHIRALETALGTPLFESPRRNGKLTEAGMEVYQFARRVLSDGRRTVRAVQGLQEGEAGRVVFGASTSISSGLLPHALVTFQRRHPMAEIVLRVMSSKALAELVVDGELDAAMILSEMVPPGLTATPVYTERMQFVVGPNHPLLERQPLSAADLAKEALILSPRESAFYLIVERWFRENGVLNGPNLTAEIQSVAGIITAVEAGLGYSVLFDNTSAHARALGAVQVLDVRGTPIYGNATLIRRKHDSASPLLERFCEYLLTTLRDGNGQRLVRPAGVRHRPAGTNP